jgi:hypothetical protein
MRIIITESQYYLLRRSQEIKDFAYELIDDDNFLERFIDSRSKLFEFISDVCFSIAVSFVRKEIDEDEDDRHTYRMQVRDYIKNEFRDYLMKRFYEIKDNLM